MIYFSEQENGQLPLNEEGFSQAAWGGICAEIVNRLNDGSFGAAYPAVCPDPGVNIIGTNDSAFWAAMQGQIPSLESQPWFDRYNPPALLVAMDVIQFCWKSAAKIIGRNRHDFGRHDHLDYDVAAGREEFRTAVNLIFRRNQMAYELGDDGTIRRLPGPILREMLGEAIFRSGDEELDRMLENARAKFLSPDEALRREGLERLWDAFERVKTIGPGADKRAKAGLLLDRVTGSGAPKFRSMLETEAAELTRIGNDFQIRHSETTQEPLRKSPHVEYMFHRLFSMVRLMLECGSGHPE